MKAWFGIPLKNPGSTLVYKYWNERNTEENVPADQCLSTTQPMLLETLFAPRVPIRPQMSASLPLRLNDVDPSAGFWILMGGEMELIERLSFDRGKEGRKLMWMNTRTN